ncbi:MAG: hypothetical protein FWD31_11865 [Planctomycetaceae bacterium]|nr:hypothetical protein [Planctomycetaceae bacterium]
MPNIKYINNEIIFTDSTVILPGFDRQLEVSKLDECDRVFEHIKNEFLIVEPWIFPPSFGKQPAEPESQDENKSIFVSDLVNSYLRFVALDGREDSGQALCARNEGKLREVLHCRLCLFEKDAHLEIFDGYVRSEFAMARCLYGGVEFAKYKLPAYKKPYPKMPLIEDFYKHSNGFQFINPDWAWFYNFTNNKDLETLRSLMAKLEEHYRESVRDCFKDRFFTMRWDSNDPNLTEIRESLEDFSKKLMASQSSACETGKIRIVSQFGTQREKNILWDVLDTKIRCGFVRSCNESEVAIPLVEDPYIYEKGKRSINPKWMWLYKLTANVNAETLRDLMSKLDEHYREDVHNCLKDKFSRIHWKNTDPNLTEIRESLKNFAETLMVSQDDEAAVFPTVK